MYIYKNNTCIATYYDIIHGADMVKYTKKMLRCIKIIIFFVKCLNVVPKCCLNLVFSSWCPLLLCWILNYRNIKMRSSQLIIKSIAQKVMANISSRCQFHDLKNLEVCIFFHTPWIHHKIEDNNDFFYRWTSL
jgi:hypothetical protein